MTVGNALGGWLADRDLQRSMVIGFVAMIVSIAVFSLVASTRVGLFVGAFLVGATSLYLGPVLQARLITVAPGAQLMGAALNQSAMNIANSLGAALGSVAIAAGLGYLAPARVGVVLAIVGLILGLVSFAVGRRVRERVPATVDELSVARRPSDWPGAQKSSTLTVTRSVLDLQLGTLITLVAAAALAHGDPHQAEVCRRRRDEHVHAGDEGLAEELRQRGRQVGDAVAAVVEGEDADRPLDARRVRRVQDIPAVDPEVVAGVALVAPPLLLALDRQRRVPVAGLDQAR